MRYNLTPSISWCKTKAELKAETDDEHQKGLKVLDSAAQRSSGKDNVAGDVGEISEKLWRCGRTTCLVAQ